MSCGCAALDLAERLDRLVNVDEPDPSLRLEVPVEDGAVAAELDVAAERRDAVAVAAVQRVLGCPQIRDRLAALMNVVELGSHQAPEDPPAAMRRQDSDERHACGADEPARHAGLERKRRAAPD